MLGDFRCRRGQSRTRHIAFKKGTSIAVVKSSAHGDIETEYSVPVKKGQWLLVEIISNPADGAAFTVTSPQGLAPSASTQYAWEGRTTESGDYQITVSRLREYPASNYSLSVTLRAEPASLPYSARDKNSVALYVAMRKFINAFRNKDHAAFLAAFSRTKSAYLLNPQNIGSRESYRIAMPYSALAADINKKRGWYWTFLERSEDGEMDAFVDNFPNGTAWKRVKGNKFVPPDGDATDITFVKWRMEGKRWVVDEMSYAQS